MCVFQLKVMDSVPAPEKMSRQMFNHYFPDQAANPNFDNPGYFPKKIKEHQTDSLELAFFNHSGHR